LVINSRSLLEMYWLGLAIDKASALRARFNGGEALRTLEAATQIDHEMVFERSGQILKSFIQHRFGEIPERIRH
jgi:hypothetical protein